MSPTSDPLKVVNDLQDTYESAKAYLDKMNVEDFPDLGVADQDDAIEKLDETWKEMTDVYSELQKADPEDVQKLSAKLSYLSSLQKMLLDALNKINDTYEKMGQSL